MRRVISCVALTAAVFAVPAGGSDRPRIEIRAVTLTGVTRTLTKRAGLDTAPAVSPTTGEIAFVSDRGVTPDIYVMSPGGTGARRVTTGPFMDSIVASNDAGTTAIAWSPDGKRLAFDAQNAMFSAACSTNCVVWSVFVVNTDGTGLRFVADQARNPTWSPDGTRLAVEGGVTPYGESERVEIISLGGAPVVPLPGFNPYAFDAPAWSAADALAFQAFHGDSPPLHVETVDRNGTHLRDVGVGSQPAWSPDGRRLAFVRGGRLVVIGPTGTGLRRLSASGESASFPAWSRDGARIAFLARPKSPAGSPAQLTVVVVKTGVERRLTHNLQGSFFDNGPVWSRDGARILVPVSAG